MNTRWMPALLIGCLVLDAGLAPGQDRKDSFGDPLPPGAVGRLGSVRWRNTAPIQCIAISPDGKTLASGCADHSIRVFELPGGKLLACLDTDVPRLRNDPWSIRFAQDGKRLVARCRGGSALVFDVSGGKPVWSAPCASPDVMGEENLSSIRHLAAFAFAPDGKTAATVEESAVLLRDVSNGKVLSRFEGHAKAVTAVAFSPDGKTLASASDDGSVRLWGVSSGKSLAVLVGHTAGVASVTFSPDGNMLASGGKDRTVRLWQVSNGKLLSTLEGSEAAVVAVVFSPDGSILASADQLDKDLTSHLRSIRLWDVARGKSIAKLEGHPGGITSLAFSPDGATLVSGCLSPGCIRFWKVPSGERLSKLDRLGTIATFASGGNTFVCAGGEERDVRFREVPSGKVVDGPGQPQAAEGEVKGVAYSPDGTLLASLHADRTIRLWDVVGKRLLTSTEIPPPENSGGNPRFSIAFSPSGQVLATVSDYQVHLWELSSQRTLSHSLRLVEGDGNCVAFSPDGKTLAAGTHEAGTARVSLWDISTGKGVGNLGGYYGEIVAVAFSPDGNTLAMTAQGIHCFDVPGGKLRWVKVRDWGPVAFSPDGKTLASAEDTLIHFWDFASGKFLFQLEGQYARSMAFSPDGLTLAAVGMEVLDRGGGMKDPNGPPSIRLWDVADRKLVWNVSSVAGAVNSVAFSPDGKTIATANADSTILFWDATSSASAVPMHGEGTPDEAGPITGKPASDATALASPLATTPYANQAYGFGFGVPAGWTVNDQVKGEAVALTQSRDPTCTIRVYAAKRDHPLSEKDVGRMKALDEAALRRTASQLKPVEVSSTTVDGLTAQSFEYVYKVKAEAPRIDRSVVFGRDQDAQTCWYRVRASYPKSEAAAVGKDLVSVLESWHFQSSGRSAVDRTGAQATGHEPALPWSPIADAKAGDWSAGVLRFMCVSASGQKSEEKALQMCSVRMVKEGRVDLAAWPIHWWGGLGAEPFTARENPTVKDFLLQGTDLVIPEVSTLKPEEVIVADEVRVVGGKRFATTKITVTPRELASKKHSVTAWITREVKAGGMVAWSMTALNTNGPGPRGMHTWSYEAAGYGTNYGAVNETVDWGVSPRELLTQ